ncbi:MAG: DUF1924 domain-containing protein [Deltaproteobacteria bacterium]|nr:DUF1924 domain-containing protein [Deltaproteobacteria bacterium]
MDSISTQKSTPRTKVWDIPVRLFHWSLVLLIAVAFLTGEEDDWSSVHAKAGLAILGLLVFRIAWGFVGSRYARFRSFLRSPREVVEFAKAYVKGRPPLHLSHNPLGAVMVIALLLLLLAATGTGVLMRLGPEWEGPLTPYLSHSVADGIKETHELVAHAILVLAGLHVAGVIVSSFLERQNLVGGMITGWKRGTEEPGAAPRKPFLRALALLVSVLLGLGVALGLSAIFGQGTAEAAESPQSLLERYAEGARAEGGGVLDAERGRALYFTSFELDAKSESCAGCHGSDPTKAGRTPAGKIVQPLAPRQNSARFTDLAKASKWYDRNCKQVLGRTCTARERGDLLTWLLSF